MRISVANRKQRSALQRKERALAAWKAIGWGAVTLPTVALLADTMQAITKAIQALTEAFSAVAASDAVKELERALGEEYRIE